MKKMIALSLLFIIISHVAAWAGDDMVVAKVGDRRITMADFNRMIGYYDAEKQKILSENPVFKATILQRIVQGMVISKIARDKGFDRRADIAEQIGLMENDILASTYLKKEVADKVKITEEDMQLYYKMHQEEFKTPAMIRARHILIKTSGSFSTEEKDKAKNKAEDILKRIKAGEDFEKLATEFSEDEGSRIYGGDLGLFAQGKMTPEFDKAAFSLPEGGVSGVIESPYGYHIIKVEGKREAILEPFDKVKEKVREKVFSEFKKAKAEEFVKDAMEKAEAQVNLDAFLPKK